MNIEVVQKILEKTKTSIFHLYYPYFVYTLAGIISIVNIYYCFFLNEGIFLNIMCLLQIITCLLLIFYIKVYKLYDPKIYYDFDKLFYKNKEGKEVSKEFDTKIQKIYNSLYKPLKYPNSNIRNFDNLKKKYKKVYTLDNILTKRDCNWIIYESELYAKKNGWTTKRHANYPTVDNAVFNINPISFFLTNIVYTKIIPFYEEHYNIESKYLGISDLFVVKYSVDKGMKELEYHEDGSEFSFIIALNDEFVGGGTRFINIDKDVNTPAGSCSIFCGKNSHGGIKITKGTRYIIAGFLQLVNHNYFEGNYFT